MSGQGVVVTRLLEPISGAAVVDGELPKSQFTEWRLPADVEAPSKLFDAWRSWSIANQARSPTRLILGYGLALAMPGALEAMRLADPKQFVWQCSRFDFDGVHLRRYRGAEVVIDHESADRVTFVNGDTELSDLVRKFGTLVETWEAKP